MRGVKTYAGTNMECGDSPAWQDVEIGLLLRSRIAWRLNVPSEVRFAFLARCGLGRRRGSTR
jgi:hypothetical protein